MKEHLTHPQQLFRIVRPGRLEFDDEGNLLPHRRENFPRRMFFGGRVPMVEENDIGFIQRYFGVDENWTKLTIAAEKVESIKTGRHSNLSRPEYFGKVHRDAIISSVPCDKKD